MNKESKLFAVGPLKLLPFCYMFTLILNHGQPTLKLDHYKILKFRVVYVLILYNRYFTCINNVISKRCNNN